eukprot:s1428_g15.t1
MNPGLPAPLDAASSQLFSNHHRSSDPMVQAMPRPPQASSSSLFPSCRRPAEMWSHHDQADFDGLVFEVSSVWPGQPLEGWDPDEGLHLAKLELRLEATIGAGIACSLVPEGFCPGELLKVSPSYPLWKLPSVKIGYNPDKCSWYAKGLKKSASVFKTVRYKWYEDSNFASIAGSDIRKRLKLSKSPKPTGSLGTLYLFVHPAKIPNLRVLAQTKFYRSQLKCKDDDEDDPSVPKKANNVFVPSQLNCTIPPCSPPPPRRPPWRPERGPPGAGFGDPQCLSFDGVRFECNFLGEFLWTRCEDFVVHVFAERANSSDSSRATIIKGFAVSEQGEIAYAIAGSTPGSPFNFALDGDDENLVGNFITVTMEGTDTMFLLTASGHGIKAVFHPTHVFLEITLASQCFNRTDGLLGNNNGNPADDLRPFNKSEIIPSTSQAEVIYEKFVLSWCRDSLQDSLFPPDQFRACDRTFIPVFIADLDIDACPVVCNGDVFCCLDHSEGGEDLAVVSSGDNQAAVQAQGLAQSVQQPPPSLSLPTQIALSPDSLEFTVLAKGSNMEGLNCSVCAVENVQCNLTIIGDDASLTVTGAIPQGRMTCTAIANNVPTIGGAEVAAFPCNIGISLLHMFPL